MPPETQGVVVIDGHICESSWIANKVTVGRYGADFNVIQDAIDYCNAIGGLWTIELYTYGLGAWNEGEITHVGVANITITAMGHDQVVIAPTVAPATGVIVSGAILTLDGIAVTAPDNTMPALRVTGGTCDCKNCDFNQVGAGGNVIQMVAGTLHFYHGNVLTGDIDLSTASCNLNIYHSNIYGGIATAGAAPIAHALYIESCYLHNLDIQSLATGATTCTVTNSTYLDQITNAGTGAFYINGTSVSRINQTGAGSTTVYGGYVWQITRAVGSVVWWQDANTLKVIPSGTVTDTVIGWAVAVAGAGDTIVLHPGTYRESVPLTAGRNLVGIDKEGCLIDVTDGTTGITMAEGCRVANFTMLVTASGGNSRGIECNNTGAAATPLTIEDLNINLVRSGGNAYGISEVTGNDTRVVNIRNVLILSDTDTNETAIYCDQANKTFYILNSWVQGGDYGIFCDAASTFYIDHTHVEVNVIPPGGGTTIYCAAATMYFRACTIEKQITAGNLGIIRLKNCSYRQINRTGTGNIVDESPDLKDAPWHIERWTWQAALANSQVAVRGTPIDAGSGQVHLPVTDGGAASRVAVEALAEVAGTLGTHFTPARTPRFITQIAIDNWATAGTNFYMFYGLRETLGDYAPLLAEHHAGFEWDGTNFQAVNADGVAKQVTNLTTPANATHVQLEVIIIGGVQVEFYIDGVLVHTETANVPTAVLDWQHLDEALGNASATTINCTVRNGGVQEAPS